MRTAAELIADSIEHDNIPHVWKSDLADGELDALLAASDDYVRAEDLMCGGDAFDIWGEDDHGEAWRVLVHVDNT